MLPRAIQYGMPMHEFWHGDIDLIYAYEKAYYNHLYQSAYIHGAYNNSAFTIAYGNAWSKNKKIDYGKEIPMRDLIQELNEKQAEMNAEYRRKKAEKANTAYQKQNLQWI